ncbi:MAG: hypothetical protein BGN86_12455 [Caulobacterales bacterium 68-7]|nr:MAG: hypothetical protein BGN86_12455 [Caulobacterales bacterium 68-7]
MQPVNCLWTPLKDFRTASDIYTNDQRLDPSKDLGEGREGYREAPGPPVKTERQLDKARKDTLDRSDPLPANRGAE